MYIPAESVHVRPRRVAHRPRTFMDAVIGRYLEFATCEHDPRELPPRSIDLLV